MLNGRRGDLYAPRGSYSPGASLRELKRADFAYLRGRMAHYRNYAAGFGLAGLVLFFLLLAAAPSLSFLPIFFLFVGLGFFGRYINYLKGMRGEAKVADALEGLDNSWYCFNDVLLQQGAGNLDHIIIGPPGVFVLETKNYSGEIVCEGDDWYVKGRRTGYSSGRRRYYTFKRHIGSPSLQAKRNAAILGGLLGAKGISAWVRPLVVFSDPWVKLRVKKPTVDIVMVEDLVRYFHERTPALSDEKVKLLSEVILAGMAPEAA